MRRLSLAMAVLALSLASLAQGLPSGAVASWNLRWLGDLAFSPGGQYLAAGGPDGVYLYEAGTWRLVRVFRLAGFQVASVAFSLDGTRLAGGSWNQVLVWDTHTGEVVARVSMELGIIAALAFTPQGELLVGGSEGSLSLWSLQGPKLIWKKQPHATQIRTITFSPDRTVVVSSAIDQAVVWKAATFSVAHVIPGKAWDVAFTPDGFFLVMGWGKVIRVWDTAVWLMYREMWGHESCAIAVDVSPKGLWVASGSLDETARIWHLEQGVCVAVLQGHKGPVSSVRFSPSGAFLVTGSDDGLVVVWDLNKVLSSR